MMLGIDLVYIPEFQQRLATGETIRKVFLESELRDHPKPENLAGIFAAKEAFFKAMGKKLDWKDVWVEKDASGKPLLKSVHLLENTDAVVSISHSGEYAIAAVIIEGHPSK